MEPEIIRFNDNPKPEVKNPENVHEDYQTKDYQTQEINVEPEKVYKPIPPTFNESLFQENDKSPEENWLLFGYQASELIDALPDYVKYFWSAYKRIILAFVFILLALLTFRVLGATLNALEEIPFVAAVFQVIGIGYTIWFIFRYVVTVEKRQELIDKIEDLKKYMIG
ncbi:MAG: CAAD domain-containing protein [Limnoraphis sp. WC205]|jgi:hypothetical protein|nr:CAAD domain-containing protein [Limnoraphis sp. WC205]